MHAIIVYCVLFFICDIIIYNIIKSYFCILTIVRNLTKYVMQLMQTRKQTEHFLNRCASKYIIQVNKNIL